MTRPDTSSSSRFVGVDVSKEHLDIFVSATSEVCRLKRTAKAFGEWLRGQPQDQHFILEATGGYEQLPAQVCWELDRRCSVLNPARVRHFAKASGKLAKNDSIDAAVLARFGEALCPPPTTPVSPEVVALRSLVERRADLVAQRTSEKNRKEHLAGAALKSLNRHLRWLDGEILRLEKDIAKQLAKSEELKGKAVALQSVPGVGPVVSTTLIALLPELGSIDRRAVAALVGLAPWTNESGPRKGPRRVWGGRAAARTVLYMAAVSAARHNRPLKAHYERLVARGKAKKLALIAIARRLLTFLNAILRDGSTWAPPPALTT